MAKRPSTAPTTPVTGDEERALADAARKGRIVLFGDTVERVRDQAVGHGSRMRATFAVGVGRDVLMERLAKTGMPVALMNPHGSPRTDTTAWQVERDLTSDLAVARFHSPLLTNDPLGWGVLAAMEKTVRGGGWMKGPSAQTRIRVEVGEHRDEPQLQVGDTTGYGRVTQTDFTDHGHGVVVLATTDRSAPFLLMEATVRPDLSVSLHDPEAFTDWVVAASTASLRFRSVREREGLGAQ